MWRRRLRLTCSVLGRAFRFVEFCRATNCRHFPGMLLPRREEVPDSAGLARRHRSEAEVDRTLATRGAREGRKGGVGGKEQRSAPVGVLCAREVREFSAVHFPAGE